MVNNQHNNFSTIDQMNIIRGNYYSSQLGATPALLINHQNDGIYSGRTNCGIPALLPPKGNRRAYIVRPKGYLASTQHQRYGCFVI
jgi:hypothetical protein